MTRKLPELIAYLDAAAYRLCQLDSESGEGKAMREAAMRLEAMDEELDLLRARAPRRYILTRKSEWVRLFREAHGYLRTCHQKHGTDWSGRNHTMNALIDAMKFMEADDAARDTTLAMLREAEATAKEPVRCTKCGEAIDDGRPVLFHESGVSCGLMSDCYQRKAAP